METVSEVRVELERRVEIIEHKLDDGKVFLRSDVFEALLLTINTNIGNVREDVATCKDKFERMEKNIENLWRLLTVEFLGFIFAAAALIITAVSR